MHYIYNNLLEKWIKCIICGDLLAQLGIYYKDWELLQPLLGNNKNSKEFLASLSGESQAAGDLFECPWKCKSEQSMKRTDIKNFWDVLKMNQIFNLNAPKINHSN